MYCKKNGIAGVAIFLFLISAFALAQDCRSVLFITKDSGWSGNEFYLYGIAAESACSISKIKASDVPSADISNFSYAIVSFDAGEVFGGASCSRLRDSGIPIVYFSPHFNTVCSEALELTSGSGFTRSLNWTFADAGFYNSSGAQVFESAGPLLMPYISAHSDYQQPEIVAFKDPSKAYLVMFAGGLQKRAFISFPNYENLTLTPGGKQIFSGTVDWLTKAGPQAPTALAVLGFVRSGPFIAAVLILSVVVVALAFLELKRKNRGLRTGKRLQRFFALFVFLVLALPLAAQGVSHATTLVLARASLPVSASMQAVCRVESAGGDSNNVGLHLQADFGEGFIDVPAADSYAIKANREAWTDCDVVYDSTYCERSWVITAVSAGDVPVRCASDSGEVSSASPSSTLQISEKAKDKKIQPPVANISASENQTSANASLVPANQSAIIQVPQNQSIVPSQAQPAGQALYSNQKKEKKLHANLTSKRGFRMDESPEIEFGLLDNDTGAPEAVDSIGAEIVKEGGGGQAEIRSEIVQENGRYRVRLEKQRQIRPGVYNVKITATKGSQSFVQEQTITWGLVAVNTRRSIYHPGESAHLIVAVLDRQGFPVAGADVNVTLTSPSGALSTLSTSNGLLVGTEKGIYEGDYATTPEGTYNISVSAYADGVSSSIDTFFLAKSYYEFDVLREQPTKIDPTKGPFNAQIKISSNGPSGPFTVREYLPANFSLSNVLLNWQSYPYATDVVNDTLILSFSNVPDNSTISYTADAPKVWPVLFMAGPIEVDYASGTFVEARPWMIAVDPAVFNSTYVVIATAANAAGREVQILKCGQSGVCIENTTLDNPAGEVGYNVYDLLIDDIDYDGMLEIVYTVGSAATANQLRVLRCTAFGCVNVTGEFANPGLAGLTYGRGLAFGDADNDGGNELAAGFAGGGAGVPEFRLYHCTSNASVSNNISSGNCTQGGTYELTVAGNGVESISIGDLANNGKNVVMVTTSAAAAGGDREITVLNCNATSCVLNANLSADEPATARVPYTGLISDIDADGVFEGVVGWVSAAPTSVWRCGTGTIGYELCVFNCTVANCSLDTQHSVDLGRTVDSVYAGNFENNFPNDIRLGVGTAASAAAREFVTYNCTGTTCAATASQWETGILNYWISSADADSDGSPEVLTGWPSTANETKILDCTGLASPNCTQGAYYDTGASNVYAVEAGNITNPPVGLTAVVDGPATIQYLTKSDPSESAVFNCSVNLTKGFASSVDVDLQYSTGGGWLDLTSSSAVATMNITPVNFANQTKFTNVASWTVFGNSVGVYSIRCAANYSADVQNLYDAQYNSTSLSNIIEVGVGNLSIAVITMPAENVSKGANTSFAANLTCNGGAKAFGCPGQINLSLRFNYSSALPGVLVPVTDNGNSTIALGSNFYACPGMLANASTCFNNFTILGVHGSYSGRSNTYDIQALSNDTDVTANDTADFRISVFTGQLGIALDQPTSDLTVGLYRTFLLNATVTCSGLIPGAFCGNVSAGGRYNETAALDTLIQNSGTKLVRDTGSPTANPVACNSLGSPNTCVLKLVVNGTVSGNYFMDANYSTSDGEVLIPTGNTVDRYLTVDGAGPSVAVQAPSGGKTYGSATVGLNYTVGDPSGVSQCRYELNGNPNVSLGSCVNSTFVAQETANTVKVWANDTWNNWGVSAPVSFNVDTVSPSLTVNSPANQSWQRGIIALNYTATDAQAVDVCSWRWHNSTGVWSGYTQVTCGSGLAFNFNTVNCADNSTAVCVVEVRANDSVNNVNSTELYLMVDNAAPSVNVTQPFAGWFNGSVLVRIVVNDSASGASSVIFYNGSVWASAVLESGNSFNGIWNGTILTNAFADGTSILINANATDVLGNNGSDASVPVVQVDNNPPVVFAPTFNVSNPSNKNTNVFVNSTFNDNGGQGLAANVCTLYVSGATVVGPYVVNNSAGGSGAVNGTISANLNDGSNLVFLNCTDLQGWVGSNYTSLLVDTMPPGISIQSPVGMAYGYAAVSLNFTAFDLNGVSFCKYELSNSSGSFNVSLSGCQNSTLSGVTEGGNSVRVWANDSVNNWNSSAAVSFTVDTRPPFWVEVPQGQVVAYGFGFYYDVNATDGGVGVDKYFINDSINFRINPASGVIENNTLLVIGSYLLNVSVNDTLNNINSTVIVVTVKDMAAPYWNETPSNQVVEYGSAFAYGLNASDNVAVDKYWINDSVNFRIGVFSGLVENNTLLGLGVYLLNVSVNDTSGNGNSSLFSVTVQDLTPPNVSSEGSNVTALNVNENVCINATVADLSGVDVVTAEVWNTTAWANYTLSNSSGVCNAGGSVYAVSIPATAEGTWNYSKVFANDTRNNLQAYDFEDITILVTSFVGTVSINVTQQADGSDYNLAGAFTMTLNASCSVGLCGATNVTLQYCSGAGCSDWADVSATSPINLSGASKKLCGSLLIGQTCTVSWNVSGIVGGTYLLNGLSESAEAPPASDPTPNTIYINAINMTLFQPSSASIFNPGSNFTLAGAVECLGRFCGQVSVYAQDNESGSWANIGGRNLTVGANPFGCGQLNYTGPICDFSWNVSGTPKEYFIRTYANNTGNTLGNASNPVDILVAGQSLITLTYPVQESSVFVGETIWVNASIAASNQAIYNCDATLYNQTGLDLISGARTQPLGNISFGTPAAGNWLLNGTQLGLYNLTVNVTCEYGANSSISAYPIEVTPLSSNVTDYAYAEKAVVNGGEWLHQSSDSGLSWWRNGLDEYLGFNGSSATDSSFVSRWYVIANVSGTLYPFDFSSISWGIRKIGVSGNSTYVQYVGETGYPKIRVNFTQTVPSTSDVSSINVTLQNLEQFTVDGISLKWVVFNFSINGDSGDDVLVFTNSTGQQESYPMGPSTLFSFNLSRFGATSATFRDPDSSVYGRIFWERNMSAGGGKAAFAGFTFETGGNFSLNLTFDFGSFAPGAVKGFDPGSGLEQPSLIQRATIASMEAGESPPPAYTDVTAVETDNSLATTSDVRKVSAGVAIFKTKLLNESRAYSWIFLQMNVTSLDQTPYQTRLYAYNSDNVTVNANAMLYNVSATGSVNIDITNITHQQDGFGYLLLRLTPDTNYVTVNNRKLTIAEVRFNTTVNSLPVAYWSSPANGTWYARSATAVTINCSASDDLSVRNVTFQQSSNGLSYTNLSTDIVYSDNDWNWTYNPSLDSGPCNSTNIGTTGICYLGCFARDGNDVDSEANYSTLRIDGDAPAVTAGVTGVSEPTGWLSGGKTVTCSASDSGSGVNSTAYAYEYTLNDAGSTGWTLISGCSSTSCSWDTSSLNDATVWVRCNSTDNVSNLGSDGANYAGIDNTMPSAQIQSPANSTYSTTLISINYTYGDSLSGVSSCWYEITNSSGSFNVSLTGCLNATISGVTSGSNTVKIWLNDSVNLWNASQPVSFTVDTGYPSVVINSPANLSWQRGTAAINYTATDTQSIDVCSWRWHNATGVWSGYSTVTCGSNLAFSFNTAGCADNSTANCVVEVRANDTANNANSTEVYLRVDNAVPIVDVAQPASGWFNGTVFVRVVVNDSASGASSVVFFNGSVWVSAVLQSGDSNNGVWNGTILTNAFADGTPIQINANATDLLGNNGSDASVPTIQVDNNPPLMFAPTLNVSNPSSKNTNIFVNSTFNDNGGQGVSADTCLMYVSGNTSVSPYLITNAGGVSGAVNGTITATLNDGTNYIHINCTDQQGWTGSNYAGLLVDTQGPISTLDRPANWTNITATPYLLNTSISGLNPASWVMFEYYTGTWHSACNDTNGAPYECSWDVSGLPDAGNYRVRVRANDTVGNLGAYDVHANITIDRTPPSAILDSPLSGAVLAATPILLNASSSADAVGIYSVSFYYSPAGANSWTLIGVNTSGKTYSWAGGFPSDGVYDLNVTVNDTVGWQNSGKNTGIILNLVNDPPVCNVLYPNASGITVNGTIKVNASANDTDTGDYVMNVTFEYSSNAGGSWAAIGTNTSGNLTYYETSWDTRGVDDSSQYLIRCNATDTAGAKGADTSDNTFTVFNNLVNITQIQDNAPVVAGARVYLKANVTSPYGVITQVSVYIREKGGTYSEYTMTDTGCGDPYGDNVYCNAYYTANVAKVYEYYINATDGTYRSVKGTDISGNNVTPTAPASFSTKGGGFADPLEIRGSFGPYYAGDAVLLVFRSRDMEGLPLADQNITMVIYFPNGTVLWYSNATKGGSGYYFYNNTLPANAPVGNYLINLTMLYDSKVYTDFASFLVQSPAGLTQSQAQQLSNIERLSTGINQTTGNVKELVIESVVRVKAGDPYNATLYYYDATHALADPAGNVSVVLYDPNGTVVVAANASRVGLGKYRFDYGTANTTASGGWKLDATAGDTAATMYFYVVGGPFDVLITDLPDTFVPGVTASVTLWNTGDPKDVTLYWWTEYLNGTKVVTASETFLAQSGYIYRNLSLDHVPAGEFYFKVLLRYSGEEEASALRQFYATTPSSLAMVKTLTPDLILARTVETISVNLSVENTADWDALRSINITDEVPYDFAPPPSGAVQLWYLNSTAYVRVTSGYSVAVSDIDSDPNVEVRASIPEMSLTNIGQNLGAGEYLFLVYSMNSSRMAPNTTRSMNSTAAALDLNLKYVAANITSNITAANAILVARKKIFADPNYPANIFVNVTLTALGGTISGIAIADYLPEGTEISYVNVTYVNSTGPSRQLYNDTDFLIEPPFQTTLPDGARVDVYQYNFSIDAPVNWGNNLYENDSIELLYNATIVGGGTWILPTIIGGYDPVYKQHIKTEAYAFHRVPLFDIILELATKVVSAGGNVKGKLKLINMGGPSAQVDVLINYAIKTMSGDLVTERSKTVAVLKEKEEELSLPVPSAAKPGMYTFEALMTYTGREAMSTDVFEVKGTETEGPGVSPYWIYGAAVLAILALLAVRAGKILKPKDDTPSFAQHAGPVLPNAGTQSAAPDYAGGVQKAAGPSLSGSSVGPDDALKGFSSQKKQKAKPDKRRSAGKR